MNDKKPNTQEEGLKRRMIEKAAELQVNSEEFAEWVKNGGKKIDEPAVSHMALYMLSADFHAYVEKSRISMGSKRTVEEILSLKLTEGVYEMYRDRFLNVTKPTEAEVML